MRTDLENSLLAMITGGWADRSFGAVDEPSGHVSLVTVTEAEVTEIADAFSDVPDFVVPVGNRIVTENELGQMTVEEFPSWMVADAEFERRLSAWEGGI